MSKWTVEPGRILARDGVPVVAVQRLVDRNGGAPLSPAEADTLVGLIATALNEGEPS